jgi:hypothetical protein
MLTARRLLVVGGGDGVGPSQISLFFTWRSHADQVSLECERFAPLGGSVGSKVRGLRPLG